MNQQNRFYYLLEIAYLGFRMHGWQYQPKLKTVEGQLKKTLKFILPERKFKILGAGRTDAMVSASGAAFELFVDREPLQDLEEFMTIFNHNLPPDIMALKIREVNSSFNIIRHSEMKEYLYLFAFGKKSHPFAAPLLATFLEDLDIESMTEAAKLFEGEHSLHNFCTKPTEHTVLQRKIELCEIVRNEEITASFFPEHTYLLRVRSKGFLRNQIRLMMGALVRVGNKELTVEQLVESFNPEVNSPMNFIAPGSGLVLNKVSF